MRLQRRHDFGRELPVAGHDRWSGFDPACMVEGNAGEGKQDHADQAHARAYPVPLVKLVDEESAALLSLPNLLAVGHQSIRNLRTAARRCQFVTQWGVAGDTRCPLLAFNSASRARLRPQFRLVLKSWYHSGFL